MRAGAWLVVVVLGAMPVEAQSLVDAVLAENDGRVVTASDVALPERSARWDSRRARRPSYAGTSTASSTDGWR
jgi:hypothetical protein